MLAQEVKLLRKLTKMESALFYSTNLIFSENLWYLNLLLLVGVVPKRDYSPKLVLLGKAKISTMGNSEILNILRISTLQGQIMLIPF